MKKYKLISFVLLAAISLSAAGCSESTGVSGNQSSAESSMNFSEYSKSDGLAENEISAGVNEEADANQTVFRLNRVIDSGEKSDGGDPYIYLDVTISNPTDKEYDLSVLNNFYLLLPDNQEIHFDVRTQLYGTKNIGNYSASPFTIPANNEFSGIIGGFILPKNTDKFTVCFFPTQDNASDKSNVVKIEVTSDNISSI